MTGTKISLTMLILLLALFGGTLSGSNEYPGDVNMGSGGFPVTENITPEDPVIGLLGKTFDQIVQTLGDPQEQGYGARPGSHYYMFYQCGEGMIRIYSPVETEEKIAVSIVLEVGAAVFGAKTGLTFSEIEDIIGAPDFGPELGLDDTYYMGYYFGANKQMPEVIVSFAAGSPNSPTDETFVKWEGFHDHEEMFNGQGLIQGQEI